MRQRFKGLSYVLCAERTCIHRKPHCSPRTGSSSNSGSPSGPDCANANELAESVLDSVELLADGFMVLSVPAVNVVKATEGELSVEVGGETNDVATETTGSDSIGEERESVETVETVEYAGGLGAEGVGNGTRNPFSGGGALASCQTRYSSCDWTAAPELAETEKRMPGMSIVCRRCSSGI